MADTHDHGVLTVLPGRPGYRPLQPERKTLLQVRLSSTEKARVTELARECGYETLSAFVRDRALGQPRPAA